MRKVSKVLLLIFCFNFVGFLVTDRVSAIPNGKNLYGEKAESYNATRTDSVQTSMNLDKYNEAMGYRNFLSNNLKSYSRKVDESIGKQLIMAAIKNGLENKQVIINLDKYIKYFKNKSDYKIPMEYYYDTLDKYPEIFYSEVTVDCDASYDKSTNEITSYNLLVTYIYDSKTIDVMKTKFNKKVQEIENNYLLNAKTDLEREYIIHDYIVQHCTYDKENYYKNTVPSIEHTAYGALVNGIAVCDGYCKAAQILFRDSNIESGIVVSEFMNHAWNYIIIDGHYYYLDITWDDSEGNEEEVIYKYFNVTSSELKSGTTPHTWDELEYPICINDKFSFLKKDYKLKRFLDKMYYTDLKNETFYIYSMALEDGNESLVNNNDQTLYIETDKNYLYCLNYNYNKANKKVHYLYKFNPISKKKELVFSINGIIEDMYSKGGTLIIKYIEGGVKKTKTLPISV